MSSETSAKNEKGFLSDIFGKLRKKPAEPVELKSCANSSGNYGAFYSAQSVAQMQAARTAELHKEKFDSYTVKIREAYQTYQRISSGSTGSAAATEARWEKNVDAFIGLYKDIYKIDLSKIALHSGAAELEEIEGNIEKLQEECSLNNREEEKHSMAFTFARGDIAKSVPIIMAGIESRAAANVAASRR